ncbi:hypothetical protein HY469_03610 [Candidatus Roizmanbacteria bacterium]|nr:hypothetical protein [Candidatus Roizmanbacteria bacterium]
MKSSKSDHMYLEIGGFLLYVDLTQLSEPSVKDSVRLFIRHQYPHNVISLPDKQIAFTIKVIEQEENPFMVKSELTSRRYYVEMFSLSKDAASIHYHASAIHFQWMLKFALQQLLSDKSGFLLHASAVKTSKNSLYLFLGPNGAGKSTIVSRLSEGYMPFADDMVLIRKMGKTWKAFQLPFDRNMDMVDMNPKIIAALFLLVKRKKLAMKKLRVSLIQVERIIKQVLGGDITPHHIQSVLAFMNAHAVYTLEFPRTISASQFSSEIRL